MDDSAPIPLAGERLPEYAQRLAIALSVTNLEKHYSVGTVARAVEAGALTRIAPGWVASSLHATAFQVRARAITAWANAPLSEASALFAWGLIPTPPQVITVTTETARNPRSRQDVRIRRVARTPAETIYQGLRVVTPAEAVVGGFGRVESRMRSEVVFAAIRDRLVTTQQLRAVLASSPRVPSRPALERRIAAAEAGAHSHLEEVALKKVFNTSDFDQFARQHEVVIEGNAFMLDMFCRRTRIAIEADGARFHSSIAAWQRAIARDAWLASVGILTLRFSFNDLNARAEWCRERARHAMLHRS